MRRAEPSQPPGIVHRVLDLIHQLVATRTAGHKLGARGISIAEAEQTLWNRHVIVHNRRGALQRIQQASRRVLIGRTDGGRFLTLIVEETVDPTTWLLVTGWDSTSAERKILERL